MIEVIPFIEFENNDGKLHLNCEKFKEYAMKNILEK